MVSSEVWNCVSKWVLLWLFQALSIEFLTDFILSFSKRLIRGQKFSIFAKVRDSVVSLDLSWLSNLDHVVMLSLSLSDIKLSHFNVFIDAKVWHEIVSLWLLWLFPCGCQ